MLDIVKCHEFRTFGTFFHYHLSALYLVEIETMKRLTDRVKDIIGYINHRVDRTQANGIQTLLKPFGAFADLDSAYGDPCVTRTCLIIVNLHGDRTVGTIGSERIDRRTT